MQQCYQAAESRRTQSRRDLDAFRSLLMKLLQPVHRRFIALAFALLCMGSAGCAIRTVDRYSPPENTLPFTESGSAVMPDRWWVEFGDEALNFQIERALGENFDLAAALHRLRAARAFARREASDLFPDLDGVLGTDTTFGPGPTRKQFRWGLDASYQVDLWGQIESRVDAERFRAEATAADYSAVALTLAAEIARTWFSLIESHAQIDLLNQQLQSNRDGLRAQEESFKVRGGGPDVLRQQQLVQSTLEQIIIVKSRIAILEHQLATLTGQLPQSASFDPGMTLPELPPAPYTGLPLELVQRRPDVRSDYLAFVAADRDLAAAVTAQYPRLNIGGALVNSATSSDNLLRDWFLSIGSQLIAPLFDGGERRAEVDRTSALVSQRFSEYRQSMLIAFQEVEDSLALEHFQIQRIERLNEQVELASQSTEQLRLGYFLDPDRVSFLDYLSATQSQQRLQREIFSARLDLILIRVGLYLALAGDFDTRPQLVADSPFGNEFVVTTTDEPVAESMDSTEIQSATQDLPSPPIERLPPVEPD